ncbi:9691_t:CDS:2 [Entrophospora sp. SA101]|nr:9691_t:CDS:2 [Entrophospora sp. SA101]
MDIVLINCKINIEEIWNNAMNRLKINNIEVQSMEARIIGLTESIDWKLILKTPDRYNLIKKTRPNFLKEQLIEDLMKWKVKLDQVKNDTDAILASKITNFLLEKGCTAVTTRKRRYISPEYTKLTNDDKEIDLIIEVRSYGIEILPLEVGINKNLTDTNSDYNQLKIVLKDCMDAFIDKMNISKRSLTKLMTLGIQISDRSDKPDTAIKLSDNMQIEEIFLNQEETKEVKGGKNGKKEDLG